MQPSLFENTMVDPVFEHNAREHSIPLRDMDVGDITFLSGQNEPIHRWYRLTPSFSPGLVRFFLDKFNVTERDLVLDPFSGRGTTMIECQRHALRGLGMEINPLLQRVGQYSLEWCDLDSESAAQYMSVVKAKVRSAKDADPQEIAALYGARIPDIHDVYRWWKPLVLRDLLIAREELAQSQFAKFRHLLWLAVNTASLECANIHRNHPTITFDDDHDRDIDAVAAIQTMLETIVSDCTAITGDQRASVGKCSVELGNSCLPLPAAHPANGSVSCVITSPPYPNRYSYVHQTRPQLHFMEVIQHRSAATDIDLETVGGTWGKATSNLMKSLITPPPKIAETLSYFERLSAKSTLMCNYATKYFIDLDRHIESLKAAVLPGKFRGAYVVGNSRLSDVEIFTETILARLFQRHGFAVDEILVFRKRGGRKRLYETAVVVRA
ncbi:MAG: site-specific DNA-methyltransferase [Planctomycetota bacterium]|nr:site-specific DNA-methyltransferase [Planctomycetota bacterium]